MSERFYSREPAKNLELKPVVLCIGGGSGWCMGYWGAICALRELGFDIKGYVTRSSGGYPAVIDSLNHTDQWAREYYRKFNISDYFRRKLGFPIPKIPLFDHSQYHKFTDIAGDPNFMMSQLSVPTFFTVLNYTDKKAEYLSGDIPVMQALAASTAIPFVIGPYTLSVNGKKYLDGEVVMGNDVGAAQSFFPQIPIVSIVRADDNGVVSRFMRAAQHHINVKSENPVFEEATYQFVLKNLLGSPFATNYIDHNVEYGYTEVMNAYDDGSLMKLYENYLSRY